MQLTRNRVGMSRKAIAAGIATALLIGGIGSISAEAATKKPAAKVTKKPAAKPAASAAGKAPAYPGAPLTAGATGDAVKALQQKLGVTVTGTFDAATGKAVKAFKNSNGLGNDEIAGPKVWQKIFGA